ncbi:MAG: cell division protein ZapA [Succinivibrio sp.]
MSDRDNDYTSVSFSILAEQFSLRCKKEDEELLKAAVENVKTTVSSMLRQNPTLSPIQASILALIKTNQDLLEHSSNDSDFAKKVTPKIARLNRILKKVNNE